MLQCETPGATFEIATGHPFSVYVLSNRRLCHKNPKYPVSHRCETTIFELALRNCACPQRMVSFLVDFSHVGILQDEFRRRRYVDGRGRKGFNRFDMDRGQRTETKPTTHHTRIGIRRLVFGRILHQKLTFEPPL